MNRERLGKRTHTNEPETKENKQTSTQKFPASGTVEFQS
jgi:hypothetical protein